MNVYCVKCGGEMEIMRDLGSELRVYPCGCGGNDKPKRQPTKRAIDPPLADGTRTDSKNMFVSPESRTDGTAGN